MNKSIKAVMLLSLLAISNCGTRETAVLLEEARKETVGSKKFELYDQIILADSMNDVALYERGLLHVMYYEHSIELRNEGNNIDSSVTQKHYLNALSDFSRTIKLNPKNGMAYAKRARLYSIMNNIKDACQDYMSAFSNGIPVDSVILINCRD
ncbi:MAG: hypothetical protein IPN85_17210 [Flavobacteriales bacterium]|nr:hypothetical protein [Flavobacteriales bacterium]MBK9286679.1 hypothetical protein [Flavobacteriales bacterium]MBL0035169.1 hypothetical protein [Flavobacteriales bacterium]